MRHPLIWLVELWRRLVSPLYGDVCKYHPSCSSYALQALRRHGALKGSALAGWRILRCNPFSRGGYDPVPGTPEADAWQLEQLSTNFPVACPAGSSHYTRGDN